MDQWVSSLREWLPSLHEIVSGVIVMALLAGAVRVPRWIGYAKTRYAARSKRTAGVRIEKLTRKLERIDRVIATPPTVMIAQCAGQLALLIWGMLAVIATLIVGTAGYPPVHLSDQPPLIVAIGLMVGIIAAMVGFFLLLRNSNLPVHRAIIEAQIAGLRRRYPTGGTVHAQDAPTSTA